MKRFLQQGSSRFASAALIVIACTAAAGAKAETVRVASPDGRTYIEVETGAKGATYSVVHDGKAVIVPSPLGLYFDELGSIGGSGTAIVSHQDHAVDRKINLVVGKTKTTRDRYSESTIALHQSGAKSADFTLIARAYDDGVALRYVVRGQSGLHEVSLIRELTEFNFPTDYNCWAFKTWTFDGPHEGSFDPVKSSQIGPDQLYDTPFVCKTGEAQQTFALAQADMRDYAGVYFTGRGDGRPGLAIKLSPRLDAAPAGSSSPAVKVDLSKGPMISPWRMVMIGDRPGALPESTMTIRLASPSVIGDTRWIKPGKAAWDWWNGWDVKIPNAGKNTATYKAYIDHAAAMKLEYILIDEGWYEGSSEKPGPADVTKTTPAMNMPEIVRYASDRGVGVMVWLQWKQLDRQLDKALAQYERWGLKGIKIDFMNRNDQEMVGYYHKVLGLAAKHHLMVDFHGAYPPDGLNRTYPNYVTQEGVRGAEYNKWTALITARYNVTLPFTRMILGPMDYTPGGFRHLSPADFPKYKREIAPFVQTTRGQAIAMYVVFDSPLQMVSDSPGVYHNADGSWADGAEFISAVPTTWDETRVVAGDIGEYIVTARRKGRTWYVGAMTNEQGRTLSVPLDFLGAGRFSANVWQDGADINNLRTSRAAVDAKSALTLVLSPSGGAVAVLTPVGK
ncbi:MAG: glycoside hydrolase family 97 protein [Novosphingobium sp.]